MKYRSGYFWIPTARRQAINTKCVAAGLATTVEPGFFSVPSYQGNAPQPQFYLASATLSEEQWAALEEILPPGQSQAHEVHDRPGRKSVDAVLGPAGLKRKRP
jgi:hypothetical protein